jgi:predicted transglutaminase-like cysteine proteinase
MRLCAVKRLRVVLLVLWVAALASQPVVLTNAGITKEARQSGSIGKKRLAAWKAMLTNARYQVLPERAKLKLVNDFMNRTPFVEDIIHWKKEDYWATPIEFLETNGGDCEDFAIAKYFTLRALGIPDAKLGITYVINRYTREAHMVLAYFASPGAEPLILDNLHATILPARRRAELIPVYRFNSSRLWLATEETGHAQHVSTSDRMGRWQELQARMRTAM